MDKDDFQKRLEEIKASLEKLSLSSPLWNQRCNQALEAGEMTLEDALNALIFAASPQEEVNEFLVFLRQITKP